VVEVGEEGEEGGVDAADAKLVASPGSNEVASPLSLLAELPDVLRTNVEKGAGRSTDDAPHRSCWAPHALI
jgi:hypothetical protein